MFMSQKSPETPGGNGDRRAGCGKRDGASWRLKLPALAGRGRRSVCRVRLAAPPDISFLTAPETAREKPSFKSHAVRCRVKIRRSRALRLSTQHGAEPRQALGAASDHSAFSASFVPSRVSTGKPQPRGPGHPIPSWHPLSTQSACLHVAACVAVSVVGT